MGTETSRLSEPPPCLPGGRVPHGGPQPPNGTEEKLPKAGQAAGPDEVSNDNDLTGGVSEPSDDGTRTYPANDDGHSRTILRN
jgi:hypothetical protein